VGRMSVKPPTRTYEVLVSFSGLDVGERFTDESFPDNDTWAAGHVTSGYLRDVTEGVAGAGEVGQG
jgi:hypothetical protein